VERGVPSAHVLAAAENRDPHRGWRLQSSEYLCGHSALSMPPTQILQPPLAFGWPHAATQASPRAAAPVDRPVPSEFPTHCYDRPVVRPLAKHQPTRVVRERCWHDRAMRRTLASYFFESVARVLNPSMMKGESVLPALADAEPVPTASDAMHDPPAPVEALQV
jgi:hypothetical protein